MQAILYDQYHNNDAGVATLSATFTDFPNSSRPILLTTSLCPAGQTWNVDSIDADGVYFNRRRTCHRLECL